MFGFLKKKLKDWKKDVVGEEVVESEVKEVKEVKTKKTKEKKKAPKDIDKADISSKQSEDSSPKDMDKDIEAPVKFNVGTKQYEPDIERIKEIGEEIEELAEEVEEDFEELEEVVDEKKHKKKTGFFKRAFSSKITLTEAEFASHLESLEMLLLENNVAYAVVDKISEKLKEEVVGNEISKKELDEKIIDSLKEVISDILIEPPNIIEEIKSSVKPYVILFCGINGAGKTTSIAKVATLLKKNGLSCVMAAGDTFRAASIEQLEIHAKNVGCDIVAGEYGRDPASVGFDAISHAKKNGLDVVLIDTAGRMHTAKNLMQEIEKVAKVCKPDLKIFVGESICGNDIVDQIKTFNESVELDGIILSKADIDEKGGTAISVGHVTGKPIFFLGMGQEYGDLEVFDKGKFLAKLFE